MVQDAQACKCLSAGRFTQLPTVWCDKSTSTTSANPQLAQQKVSIPHLIPREVVLVAWGYVLSLLTGYEDVAYGLVDHTTTQLPSDPPQIVPFRISLPQDRRLEQLMEGVTDALRKIDDSSEHTESACAGCSSGTSLRVFPTKEPQNGEPVATDIKNTKVVFEISFQPFDHMTTATVTFHQYLYTHEFVSEVLRHATKAVEAILDASKLPQHDPNLDLLLRWTKPCDPVPPNALLHTEVEEQSRSNPSAIAVGQSERVMTYGELNQGADLLADRLLATTTNHEIGNVGIFFEKSPFAIMSMLAVLKAGGTYVPLDVDWPQQRIATVINHARISTVLCSHAQSSHLDDDLVPTLVVDERSVYKMKMGRSSDDKQGQRPEIDSSKAAYMLYTSGSTGTPKGIPVSHRAISTAILAIGRHLGIDSSTRTFQYTTFTFDLNIADIWMTLSQGGRICLPTEDERLNPNEFIDQERCNYAMITPTAAATLDVETLHGNIGTLALIGEAVPEQLLHRLATRDGSLKLYNTWGPTEASVIASSSENIVINEHDSLPLHPNDIGDAVGCSMFLVSPTDPNQLAAAFAPGEIALVGNTLANGYHENAEKTAEAFRTDLEWTKNDLIAAKVGDAAVLRRVYLTGDIGRYNPNGDGSIIFINRKEGGYVKINGYRVDPGEVESRVTESGLSQQGVCVLSYEYADAENGGDRQVLVCFFVAGQESVKAGSEIKIPEIGPDVTNAIKKTTAQLHETVPEYMIPRLFVPLVSMPILTSHKIDRKSLVGMLDNHSWSDLVKQYGV